MVEAPCIRGGVNAHDLDARSSALQSTRERCAPAKPPPRGVQNDHAANELVPWIPPPPPAGTVQDGMPPSRDRSEVPAHLPGPGLVADGREGERQDELSTRRPDILPVVAGLHGDRLHPERERQAHRRRPPKDDGHVPAEGNDPVGDPSGESGGIQRREDDTDAPLEREQAALEEHRAAAGPARR